MAALLDFVFPPRCGGCGRRGTWLCGDCGASARRAPCPPCLSCGRPVSISPCPLCLDRVTAVSSLVAVFVLEGPVREAVHTLKYGDRPQLARPLGALASAALDSQLPPVVLPVPLHRRRRAQRGYNQAELIAAALEAGKPAPARGLTRVRSTPPQVKLSGEERRAAMTSAFAWTSPEAAPEVVLLVDDVITTGATMLACAEALAAAGSREIHCLGLALG